MLSSFSMYFFPVFYHSLPKGQTPPIYQQLPPPPPPPPQLLVTRSFLEFFYPPPPSFTASQCFRNCV